MKRAFTTLILLLGLAVPVASVPATAGAVDVFRACSGGGSDTAVCKGTDDKILGSNGILTNVINLLLTVIGIIAVIMIIVGGIRYTTSNGDASQTKSAQNTILYAVVGLVIAIMAYAIVRFVVNRI